MRMFKEQTRRKRNSGSRGGKCRDGERNQDGAFKRKAGKSLRQVRGRNEEGRAGRLRMLRAPKGEEEEEGERVGSTT